MLSIPLFECVRRQEVDFGIGPQSNDSKSLCFQPIYSDEMCALVPRAYKLTRKTSITLREISQFPFLAWGKQTTVDAVLTPILEREGISFGRKYEVSEPHTLLAMSAAGLGIAILPRIMLPAQGHPSLRILPLADVSLSRQISIITLRGNAFSPAAAHLAQILERLIDPEKAKQYAARS
jgi:DNA-binding transcriptional LysR family regulator